MDKVNLCKHCGENKTNCELCIEDAYDMLEAVINCDLPRIQFLIQKGKSPNIHDDSGYTALHQAVQCNRYHIINIVEYLLTLPNINLEQFASFYKKSPLLLSAELKTPRIAEMLINKGANLMAVDLEGNTVLHNAVLTYSLETLRFFLTKGIDVNLTNKRSETPLYLALVCNDFELVSMLLYYNADTNTMDKTGLTPFMRALFYNRDKNIQRELFKYECDYNRKAIRGNTLYMAITNRSPLIIDLIENGASVNYYCNDMYQSILASILESCDSEIFFYVFPLINLSILTEFKESIFYSLLKCKYNKEDWLKALYLILESNVLNELIDHYYILKKNPFGMRLQKLNSFFASFAKVFKQKNISEHEFVKFIDICLCSGADVLYEDIKIVYAIYSNNKALPHLLNMEIKNLPRRRRPTLPYIFCSFNKNFAFVLNKYYNCGNWANPRVSRVPSLLELSRNKLIVAICAKYDIKSSHWYYYILSRLNLPKIIYDFLTFRRLIE